MRRYDVYKKNAFSSSGTVVFIFYSVLVFAADKAVVSSIRLSSIEGTVSIENKLGKALIAKSDLQLLTVIK